MRIAYKDRIGQKFNKLLILDFEIGNKIGGMYERY